MPEGDSLKEAIKGFADQFQPTEEGGENSGEDKDSQSDEGSE